MEKKAGKLKGSTCVHLFNFRSEFPNPWPTHTDASQTWVDLDKDRSISTINLILKKDDFLAETILRKYGKKMFLLTHSKK